MRFGRIVAAGTAYAVAVLLIGTALGVVRVLALESQFGALEATAIELPLMLGVAWLLSAWLAGHCEIPPRAPDRLLMGGLALLVLIGAESLMAAVLGRTADYREPAALLGLAGQIGFAFFPLLQARFLARRFRALP